MGLGEKLRSAAETLVAAADVLRSTAGDEPLLERPRRAIGRIADAASRPLRVGILGETNSGKSSLANLLVGVPTLPAHPVKNTRLPTLLKFAQAPFVAALYESGERIAFPAPESIPEFLASLYENGGRRATQAGKDLPEGAIKRLEVGLQSNILRSVEILDSPGTADALSSASSEEQAHHEMDAAIWTTVATQAWRASEQAQWLQLPEAVRSRGLLAVTYCDMVAGGRRDLKRLRARLENSAMPHFRGICFLDARKDDPVAVASETKILFTLLQYLAEEFSAKRLDKALPIAQRVLTQATQQLGAETRSAALAGKACEPTDATATSSGDFTEIAAFLKNWPTGDFAEEARMRIVELRRRSLTRRGVLIGLGASAAGAAAGGGIMYVLSTPSITPREAPPPVLNDRPIRTFTGHTAWIHSLAFSPDGRTILSAGGDNVLKLWDIASGKELQSFAGFPDGVRSAAFSPDARTILCGGNGGTMILVDAGTGKVLRTFEGHSDGVPAVAFSPDGRYALSGSWDKTLKLWDVAKGTALRTFSGHTGEVNAAAFSPGGKTVLSGSRDKMLRLWDTATGRVLRTFTGHTDWISAAIFAPDGRAVLSSSTDNTLRLWDVATGKELRGYPGQGRDFSPVTFSPDGRTILSGGYTALKLWDAASGRELGAFTGHVGGVTAIAASPDGRTAVSGGMDKMLRLWEVSSNLSVSERR